MDKRKKIIIISFITAVTIILLIIAIIWITNEKYESSEKDNSTQEILHKKDKETTTKNNKASTTDNKEDSTSETTTEPIQTTTELMTEPVTEPITDTPTEPVTEQVSVEQNVEPTTEYVEPQTQPEIIPQTVPQTGPETPPVISQPSQGNSYVDEVIALVNVERNRNGLPSLSKNDTLCAAANTRANELINVFSHTRPNGTSCMTVFGEYGFGNYRAVGENIAAGQPTPAEVVEGWMNSPGHRANILNTQFTQIGVGCITNNDMYGIYWVQLFYTPM